jgi:hypothetical protein
MSRVSDYQGVGKRLDRRVAALRSRGVDPATVSVACALGWHDDCTGTIDVVQYVHGNGGPQCECPGRRHPQGHPGH